MLISYNWLKKHVNLPDSISAAEVAAKLKASTVEVEGVEVQGKNLEGVVVGKVLSAEKHPNADKLKVCSVDIGGEQLTIVCGGSNVQKGMLVALAKVGAKVKWHGEGEEIELKPTAIRGVESMGMICASTEIGLGEMFPLKEEKEILDLSSLKVKPGVPLAKALGLDDAVLEIDNKSLSNRPDLWGHYGIAREVAVLFNKKLNVYKTEKIKPGKDLELSVTVQDAKLCPRYMAVAVSGVSVGPSLQWLQKSLLAAGQRPINNIVDITNFVMMDLGQPMHAFDASRIANFGIVVRKAKDGEEFVTLDKEKRKLDLSMLVIADAEKSLAVAGVMGGLDSGITNTTTTIIFESANFEAASIRRTSTKLGLRSDSSARFEKSLDPNLAEIALAKAVKLVLECCPKAKVASKVVDVAKFHLQQGPIRVSLEFLENKIGAKVPRKEIIRILEALGFEVKGKDELAVIIPSWRATKDISTPEDLVEEIIRIYGFDKIGSQMPAFAITPPEISKLKETERIAKNILVNSLAYTEVYNYSFVSGAQLQKIGDDSAKYLELDNPLSKEKPYLRRCLLLNLLENLENNQAGKDNLKLFEIGKVFRPEDAGMRAESKGDELLPGQDTWLTAVCLEKKKNAAPFWEVRRVVEELVLVGLPVMTVSKSGAEGLARHPSRCAGLFVDEQQVGSVYELHPQAAESFGLEGRVGVVKINLSALADLPKADKKYFSIAEFPAVERDLAILVKKNIAHADIMAALMGADSLLRSVDIFDIYEGENIGADYKSMAYHFVYQSAERTLTTEEVDKAHEKLINILKEKFAASVR